ncbi:MAG TPA: hypothetical protein DEQ01_00335 [Thermoanaerobacter sp.]|nr:hypothetical protein [Thermoanaerobacter sp.]
MLFVVKWRIKNNPVCPRCGKITSKIYDYGVQRIKDVINHSRHRRRCTFNLFKRQGVECENVCEFV